MIDLAGSEAARDVFHHTADRMREAREINVSLSVLKDCIRGKVEADAAALHGPEKGAKGQKPHIPFRSSRLTKVLKHLFDPSSTRKCKTVVIACINPSIIDVGASRKTLRYAEMQRVVLPQTDEQSVAQDGDAPGTWSPDRLRHWIDQNLGFESSAAFSMAHSETSTDWSARSLAFLPSRQLSLHPPRQGSSFSVWRPRISKPGA